LAYDLYSQMYLDENVNTMNIFTYVIEESIYYVIEVIDKAILDIKNKYINFDEDIIFMMKKTHKTGVVSTLEDCISLCSY
ncbi:insulinase family protein, partial [Clostridium perfringens]